MQEFYLAGKDKIYMTSTGVFSVASGASAIDPKQPEGLNDAMHLYDVHLPAYTFNTSDCIIKPIDNRRFTMKDIGLLERRLENVEYYTQLSLLESEAQNMQIQDADGFDRFKNGIIVDNFTGHGIADVSDNDYSVSMDLAQGEMRPAFHADNIGLVEADSSLENSTSMTDAIRTTNGYQKTGDLITLPYESTKFFTQPYASTSVNLNPYDTIPFLGHIDLSPDIDEWIDTERKPDLVSDLPGTFDTLSSLASEGVLKLNTGTVWNNWNDFHLGAVIDKNKTMSSTTSGNTLNVTTTINTEQRVTQRRTGIRTALVPNTIKNSLGDRVINLGFVSFIRSRTLSFTASGMRPNQTVFAFFDGKDISSFVTPTGSSAGATITTDSKGSCSGTFTIPDPNVSGNPRWRTGNRSFRLTSDINNSLTADLFTSAETDYVAKGMMQTVQQSILSTREPKVTRKSLAETTDIIRNGKRIETISIEQATYNNNNNRNSGGGGDGGGGTDTQGNSCPVTDDVDAFIRNRISLNQSNRAAEARKKTNQALQNFARTDPGLYAASYQARQKKQTAAKQAFRSNAAYGGYTKPAKPSNNRTCGRGPHDPVAQSFTIYRANGLFITSLDLYFKTKSTNLPVTVQLRTMENGYPTRTVIPFGEISKAAADVNVSTDGTTATTFTFPSPVYLQEATEYCFVALCSTDEYTIYTARMGQKILDGSRLISKQPILGSMFKSQNAGTWTAEQNEDVKFDLSYARFTENTTGTIYLVNDEIPVKTLVQNPITTTSGSTTLTVHHRNHGMHSTSNNVTIAGVPSGTHNGIASTNINGTYTTIGNIKLDSYTVTAQNSDAASASGDIGGTTVTATRNMLFDVIQPIVGTIQGPAVSLTQTMRTTGGRTLEGSETEFNLQTVSNAVDVPLNQDRYMTAPGMIASSINETNEMSGSKSFCLTVSLFTPLMASNQSPVIDTRRMSLIPIQNRLNNPISGTTPDFVEETTNIGGSSAAKYMTRPVILANESTALDIRISANVRSTSAVKMYFRTSSADDARLLSNVAWTAFNDDGSPDSAVTPAGDDATVKEHKYSVSDIPAFSAFQIKTVLTGTNSSYPPLIKDMRGIALAV